MQFSFDSFRSQGVWISNLEKQIKNATLPHALLLQGDEGTGKKTLAGLISAALLCRGEGKKPCGECASCRLLAADEHPDLIRLRKGFPISGYEKGRAHIPVDDIRELIRICSMHPSEGDRRIVLIHEADTMTEQAQNALLKTLEDPPPGTWFLLLKESHTELLSTIGSRCRTIRLHAWDETVIERALKERHADPSRISGAVRASGGSIGKALRIIDDEDYWKMREDIFRDFFCCKQRSDILRISGAWKDRKRDAGELFSQLENHIEHMLQLRLLGGDLRQALARDGYPEPWVSFSENCDLSQFSRLLDGIAEARKKTDANVNFQAVTEQLLLLLMEAKDR